MVQGWDPESQKKLIDLLWGLLDARWPWKSPAGSVLDRLFCGTSPYFLVLPRTSLVFAGPKSE